ncbi:MAG: translation initiation factor IF-6 [Candidatus Nanoarchaeia archaeon]
MAKIRHIYQTDIHGNPNVGLCGYANDEFALVGAEFTKKQAAEIGKVLKVPVHRISIAGTSLVGVFIAGNSQGILVPSITFDYELRMLEKLKINYHVIDTKLTALGNNILCNDRGALVNPDFTASEIREIKTFLKVPVTKATIDDVNIVGAMAAKNRIGGIINRDAKPKEIELAEKTLGIALVEGTVNIGTVQVKSGLICNMNGFIVGKSTSGPEVINIDEALGFIEVR